MNQSDFIKAVNQKFDLASLLRAMGHRVDRIPVTMLCPFHEDRSKSAKLYEDNRLYCWTCHKMYGPYDALQRLGISDAEIKRRLSKMGVILLEEEKGFTVDAERAHEMKTKFRLGKIPLRKMLDELYVLVQGEVGS